MFTKSETNNAIVARLTNVRKHPNADRLQLADVLGTQVIVGLDSKEGDLVLYFDSNLRLSAEYIRANNLSSCTDLNADPKAKGHFPKTGRVRAQKLRGEFSNGFVANVTSLLVLPQLTNIDVGMFVEGLEFTHVKDVEICSKYVPILPTQNGFVGKHKRKKVRFVIENFWQHWDTKQVMRNLFLFETPRTCYIEEKIHGTSGRTGYLKVKCNRPWWKFWIPREEWKVVSGTRRVDSINGHISTVRKAVEDQIGPKLHKGEQVYYEIFGYAGDKAIQPEFTYGCRPGEFKVLIYRVTITTEDGQCYDLDRLQVYVRAHQLGYACAAIKHISLMDAEQVVELCKRVATSTESSTIDGGTMLEGIVIWFQDSFGNWVALKHKTNAFLEKTSKQMDEGTQDAEDYN